MMLGLIRAIRPDWHAPFAIPFVPSGFEQSSARMYAFKGSSPVRLERVSRSVSLLSHVPQARLAHTLRSLYNPARFITPDTSYSMEQL